jgi:hypothetical protein
MTRIRIWGVGVLIVLSLVGCGSTTETPSSATSVPGNVTAYPIPEAPAADVTAYPIPEAPAEGNTAYPDPEALPEQSTSYPAPESP